MNKDFLKVNSSGVWESVEIARHRDRPTGQFYIEKIFVLKIWIF